MIDETGIAPKASTPRRRTNIWRTMAWAGGGVVLVALVRVITGADDLTSAGTFSSALRLAVPILLAGLGGLFAERCGVVNIGLEGMMIFGTWFGAWGATTWGPWQGVAIGLLGGAAGGLIHAIATVTFNVDHVISGVAINILGAGVARYLSVIAWVDKGTGGGATQSPKVQGTLGKMNLPILAGGNIFGWDSPDVLGRIASWHWFVVSDVAGVGRALTGDLSWLAVIALLLVPTAFYFLWRTSLGLRMRSSGENPWAAESLGVNVVVMKYIGVTVSGALAGLGGAFLAIELSGIYRENQTGGRGFIALAALIFGNWSPIGVLLGAALFGFSDALRLRDPSSVHALLLLVSMGAGLGAAWMVWKRRWPSVAVLVVVAAGFGWWYGTSDAIPREFLSFTPHIVTLLVLTFATQRLRPPAADGLPYRKGEGD